MNKELSKEQKQQAALGAILIGGFLYCCWMFGYKPLQQEKSDLIEQKKELSFSIKRSQGLKNSKAKIDELLQGQREKLLTIYPKLPPLTNPMVWAASLVRQATGSVGIPAKNRSITILSGLQKAQPIEGQPIVYVKDLNVEITVLSTYHKIGRLISYLETSYPFMSIKTSSINASQTTGILEARLLCIFPLLTDQAHQKIKEGAAL